MKQLLSDEIVELILNKIEGIGYCDILDMIDRDEVHFKEEKGLDERRSLYVGKDKLGVPVYNKSYSILVGDAEIPFNSKIKSLGTCYEDNRTYMKALTKQYNKFLRKVYIDSKDVNGYLDKDYNVYYDDGSMLCFNVISKDDKFTIEELSKIKFYVMK